jgi:hypothetical protein
MSAKTIPPAPIWLTTRKRRRCCLANGRAEWRLTSPTSGRGVGEADGEGYYSILTSPLRHGLRPRHLSRKRARLKLQFIIATPGNPVWPLSKSSPCGPRPSRLAALAPQDEGGGRVGKQGVWSCLWGVRYVAKALAPRTARGVLLSNWSTGPIRPALPDRSSPHAAPALDDGPQGANSGSGPWSRWPGGAGAPGGASAPETRDAGDFHARSGERTLASAISSTRACPGPGEHCFRPQRPFR